MSVTCDPDFSESADKRWLCLFRYVCDIWPTFQNLWWLWSFRYVCDIWPRLFRICYMMIMIVQICLWHLTQTFQNLLHDDYDCSDMSVTFDPDFSESTKWWLWLFKYAGDIWHRCFPVCLAVIMIVQMSLACDSDFWESPDNRWWWVFR